MFHCTGTRAWTLVPSPQSFAVNFISQKQASCLTPLRCMNNKVKQEPYKTDRHYREKTHGGTSVQVLLQPTCWAGGISQAMQSCDIIANPLMVSSNGSGVIKAGLAGDRFLSTVFTLCWLKPWGPLRRTKRRGAPGLPAMCSHGAHWDLGLERCTWQYRLSKEHLF